MSALPPKADICSALAHVRFVPIADIGSVTSALAPGFIYLPLNALECDCHLASTMSASRLTRQLQHFVVASFTQKVSHGLGKPKPEIRLDRPGPVSRYIIGKTETLMHKSILAMTAAVALTFAVTTASEAFARGPGGSGGGPGGGPGFAGGGAPTYPPGFSKGHKVGWHGNSVPPGWSKGNKKGWNGHNVPPGLYGRL
jgi:hypothetical protein